MHIHTAPVCPATPSGSPSPQWCGQSREGYFLGGWNFPEGQPASLLQGCSLLLAVPDSELLQPVIFSSRWRHSGLLLPTE